MAKIDNLILERFADAVQLLDTHKHHPLLDVPLWHWLASDDSPMPVAWLDRSVREVLQIGLARIALLPGIGPRKLERVMLAVDRARSAITHNDPAGPDDAGQSCGQLGNDEFPYRVACDAHFRGAEQTRLEGMDERGWRCVAQLVRHHGLEGFSLGRFAQNLHELDRALWDVKISTFTQRPLSDLVLLKGCGALRLQQSICGILSLAFILYAAPTRGDMRVSFVAGPISEANRWLMQPLPPAGQELPVLQSIRDEFLRPLLIQIERDGNSRLSEVARRRIGNGTQTVTWRELGVQFGVTSDRVRTLVEQAAHILHVRWQEGAYLLRGKCDALSARGDAAEHCKLLNRIHVVLFTATARAPRQPASLWHDTDADHSPAVDGSSSSVTDLGRSSDASRTRSNEM